MSGNNELKEIFVAEAMGQMEELNQVLTKLEKAPKKKEPINTFFRVIHTLKGNAAAMGFTSIAELGHSLEDYFTDARAGTFEIDESDFTVLFKVLDVLDRQISGLKSDEKVSYRGVQTKLNVLLRNKRADQGETKSEEESNKAKNANTKKTAVKKASKSSPSAKPKRTKKPVEKKEVDKAEAADSEKEINLEEKISAINQIIDTMPVLESDEIEIQEADDIELAIDDTKQNDVQFSDLVQVPVRKLDNLLNLVGELVIERDRLAQISHHTTDLNRLHRISSDLQYSVMDVRLVQVGVLFNKFHRVVRDTAVLQEKKVELNLEGNETEIDRNVLQTISDSLIHIIRNAVSHGIEDKDTRKSRKKDQSGTITLRARGESDAVIIEIEDDGNGINYKAIKRKAIEKKLVLPELADRMAEEELLMFIFEPGFSSVEVIDEISGRGVGLDVVKKAIDSIGGNIEVQSVIGRGTKISLILPSSMAVKGTLLFELGKVEYAIPLSYTESVSSIYKKDLHKVARGLVTTIQDETISVVYLKDLLQSLEPESDGQDMQKSLDETDEKTKMDLVICSYNQRKLGIIVDRLLQQKEIVEKPLQAPLDHVKSVSGVTILGNGNVCLVMNIPTLVQHVFRLINSKPSNSLVA